MARSGDKGPPCGVPVPHDPDIQIGPDQPDHSRVADPSLQPVDQDVVIDPIEELLRVHTDGGTLPHKSAPMLGAPKEKAAPWRAASKPNRLSDFLQVVFATAAHHVADPGESEQRRAKDRR